jgi:hypothetical protein
MARHFPRAYFGINVEGVRAFMDVDLFQHPFDRALAFIGDGERRINARSNPRSQIQDAAIENQRHTFNGSANGPRERSDVFEQISVKASEALVGRQSVREVFEARHNGAACIRLGGQLFWLQSDPDGAPVGMLYNLEHAASAAFVRLTIKQRKRGA